MSKSKFKATFGLKVNQNFPVKDKLKQSFSLKIDYTSAASISVIRQFTRSLYWQTKVHVYQLFTIQSLQLKLFLYKCVSG